MVARSRRGRAWHGCPGVGLWRGSRALSTVNVDVTVTLAFRFLSWMELCRGWLPSNGEVAIALWRHGLVLDGNGAKEGLCLFDMMVVRRKEG